MKSLRFLKPMAIVQANLFARAKSCIGIIFAMCSSMCKIKFDSHASFSWETLDVKPEV